MVISSKAKVKRPSMSFFAQAAWEITWGYMRPFLTAQLEKECSMYSSCIKSWIYAHRRETHWLSAAPARDNTCPLDNTFVKRGCRFLKYLYAVMVIVVSSSCIFLFGEFWRVFGNFVLKDRSAAIERWSLGWRTSSFQTPVWVDSGSPFKFRKLDSTIWFQFR